MRRSLLPLLVALLAVSGCANTDDPGGVDFTPPSSVTAADYTLQVTASTPQAVAGAEVTFTARLLDADGVDITEQYDLRTEISPALGVMYDGGGVYRFTNTDTYTYFAQADVRGATIVGAAQVVVLSGAAYSLDVELDVPITLAGVPVGVTSTITDAYGNEASGEVTYAVDAPATVSSANEVVSESTGSFTVTGTLLGTDATDSDSLTVLAAEPASLSISLSSYDVEKGDGIVVNVDVRDQFGNPSDVMPALSTSPAPGTVAWGNFVRFDDEGFFTVEADIAAYSLHAEDGPVLVDSTGPSIRLTTPSRGAEIPSANGPTVLVTGSVSDAWTGVVSVTINGAPATLTAGGLFSYRG